MKFSEAYEESQYNLHRSGLSRRICKTWITLCIQTISEVAILDRKVQSTSWKLQSYLHVKITSMSKNQAEPRHTHGVTTAPDI